MKKTIALTFVLTILLCLFGTAVASAATSDYFTYTVSNGEATITDCSRAISGRVTIPSTLGGYPVTSIGNSAFSYCESLRNITIPDSVTSIGASAFYGCTSLTSITIPDGVKSIGSNAFDGCSSLASITIPNSVTSIESGAFDGCSSLTSITIPDGVKSIGSNAFNGCSSLTSITIPDGVKSIGYYAFYGCTSLTNITMPNSLTSIDSNAFYGCTSLTNITMPNSLTSIGSNAFYGCTKLTNITIPSSVTSIGERAFYNTGYYKNVNNWDNDVLYMNSCLIESKNKSTSSYNIKQGTRYISDSAFKGCTNLTDITILNSVKRIGYYAFSGCTGLTTITIPDGVTRIDKYAFENCTSLINISIPNSATSIGYNAFYKTGYYNNTNNWDNDVLYIDSYLAKAKNTLSGSYAIKQGTICIGGYAFGNCKSLTDITIPNSIISICSEAFSTCTGLTNITIPDGVTSIESRAFYGCESLSSITIGNSITSIGDWAFSDCESLTTVNYNAINCTTMGSMESSVFENCTSLKTINIGEKVKIITSNAFDGCTSLTSITIPDSVTSIGNYAFDGCRGLTNITIPDSVTSIGDYAFYDCTNLKTVYYFGKASDFAKISIGTNNSDFENAEVIYVFKIKIFDMLGNVLCEKTQFGGDPIDLSEVIDDNAQYYLYRDSEKISKYDITSPITSDLVLYADVFHPTLETITITGKNSADLGETITETVYFATNKDIKYISFDVRFPEHLKYRVMPVDFMYVEETSSKTENGFTALTLTCVYSNSGYAPKNKTIIPFELEFELDKHAKVGEFAIEILDTTKYGTGTLEPFTAINSTSIEINPILAESVTISGEDAISEIATYTATITPDYTTNKSIEWSVSDSSIATITQEGVLKPIKNGRVTIYAKTLDGSNLVAEKVVNVSVKAKLETLSTNIGDWECDFNNEIREYIVYVPENCENISVSADYNGDGVLKINSKLSITGTQSIQLDNVTTTILVERVDAGTDYIDGSYTLTVVKTKPFTKVTVSEDGMSFDVRAYLVNDDSKIILALYKDKKFITMYDDLTIQGETIPFTVAEEYDMAKVMVWERFDAIRPLCNAIEIER